MYGKSWRVLASRGTTSTAAAAAWVVPSSSWMRQTEPWSARSLCFRSAV